MDQQQCLHCFRATKSGKLIDCRPPPRCYSFDDVESFKHSANRSLKKVNSGLHSFLWSNRKLPICFSSFDSNIFRNFSQILYWYYFLYARTFIATARRSLWIGAPGPFSNRQFTTHHFRRSQTETVSDWTCTFSRSENLSPNQGHSQLQPWVSNDFQNLNDFKLATIEFDFDRIDFLCVNLKWRPLSFIRKLNRIKIASKWVNYPASTKAGVERIGSRDDESRR